MRPIEGMSVLVTGGGSGIGEGVARRFAMAGARVTICGRRQEHIDAVAASLGSSVLAVRADVTVAADREALVAAAVEHGGDRLDVLVNNAGNMYRAPLAAVREDELMAVLNTNVVGAVMLTQAALEPLRAARGAVIFVGSIHTQRAFPGAAPYAATKGAVETLTRVLAAELGPDQIRVSCVRPGAVFTEINQRAGLGDDATALARLESLAPAHALGRIGTVDEVAEAVEHLARAEWTTGTILTVDGGLSLGVTYA
jgi:NAD(P)-dependent dehydrogenase (short-subunit alcohol dehydrogenase family)